MQGPFDRIIKKKVFIKINILSSHGFRFPIKEQWYSRCVSVSVKSGDIYTGLVHIGTNACFSQLICTEEGVSVSMLERSLQLPQPSKT